MIHGDVSADLLRTIFTPELAAPRRRGDHPRRPDRRGRGAPAAGRDLDPHRALRDAPPRRARHHRADRRGRRRRVRGERPDQPGRARPDRAQPDRGRARPGDPGAARPGRRPARRVRLAVRQPSGAAAKGDRRACASSAASSGARRHAGSHRRPRSRPPRRARDAAAGGQATPAPPAPTAGGCRVRRRRREPAADGDGPRRSGQDQDPAARSRATMPPSPRRPPGPAGEADPRPALPQLAAQARGGRPGDPAVRRAGPVAEHADATRRRDPGPTTSTSRPTRSLPLTPSTRSPQIRYFAPSGVPVAASSTSWPPSTSAGSDGQRAGVVPVPIDVTIADSRVTRPRLPARRSPRSSSTGSVAKPRSRSRSTTVRCPDGLTLGEVDRRSRDRSTVSGPASVIAASIAVARRRRSIQPVGHRRRPGRPARRRSTSSATRVSPVEVDAGDRPRHDPGLLRPPEPDRCRSTRSSPARRPPASRSQSRDGRPAGRARRRRRRRARRSWPASTPTRSR